MPTRGHPQFSFLGKLFVCCTVSVYFVQLAAGAPPEEPVDPQLLFVQGRDLFQEGKTSEAMELYRRAGTNGLMRAQATLAELLFARGDEASRTEALRWAMLAAREGDPIMRTRLASELREGDPPEYFHECRPWLERLAVRGDSALKFRAGLWAFIGCGGPKDFERAYSFLLAANRDETFRIETPQCPFLLGYLLENGFGNSQDYPGAARLYWQAAELGWPPAVYRLGLLIEDGNGVATDKQLARLLYLRAAALGDAAAAYHLGLLARSTATNSEGRSEAFQWFLRAATNDFCIAQAKVGESYEQGWSPQGVDRVEAIAWYKIAALKDHRSARLKVEDLERSLAADQRVEVEPRFQKAIALIHKETVKAQPGENLLPESVLSKRNDLLAADPVSARPRTLGEVKLLVHAPNDEAPNGRRNDVHSGLMKGYLEDLAHQVRQIAASRLNAIGKTVPVEELELILSYRLCSDGRVEDVDVVDTNLDEMTAEVYAQSLEDARPLPRWTPGLRAELTEEYQDLVMAFGAKSVLRISQ
jgi:TPR repeat protein